MLRAYLRSSRGNTPAQITFIYSLIDNYDSLHRSPFRSISKEKRKKNAGFTRYLLVSPRPPMAEMLQLPLKKTTLSVIATKAARLTRNFPTFIRLSMQRGIDARFLNLEVDT